ncbi:MAG: DUF3267 domain-containing protein [Clostridia bacterium]|nr:DUF3267 domain-containing protein [Clostridia bacterium]
MEKSRNKNFEKELPEGFREALHVDAREAKFGIIFNLISIAVLAAVMVLAVLSLRAGGKLSLDMLEMEPPLLLLAYLVLFVSMIAYVVLHELVHGIAYKALTGERLTFGMSWSCAFCGVPNIYTYKRCALISVLAPFTVFNILFIPALAVLYFVSPLYYLICAFIFGLHFGGCSGDLYVTYLLLVRFRGKKTLMRDTGPEQFFYTADEN